MVVGFSISGCQSKQLVSGTLKKAIKKRNPDAGLIFHSDRGGQYISISFSKLLREYGFEQSLSASGSPYDNAVAESFFSTLKKEELYRHDYRSVNEMKRAVAQYIEFYNQTCVHNYLGYLSWSPILIILFKIGDQFSLAGGYDYFVLKTISFRDSSVCRYSSVSSSASAFPNSPICANQFVIGKSVPICIRSAKPARQIS